MSFETFSNQIKKRTNKIFSTEAEKIKRTKGGGSLKIKRILSINSLIDKEIKSVSPFFVVPSKNANNFKVVTKIFINKKGVSTM